MDCGPCDLRLLVEGLGDEGLAVLRDAVDTRLCREKYGAETIEGLMLSGAAPRRAPPAGKAAAGSTAPPPAGAPGTGARRAAAGSTR